MTSRHDYLPFGEELGAGTGVPAARRGCARQHRVTAPPIMCANADTRLDDATGLDHTLWRKLETKSGRWTTPDPYGNSLRVGDPPSFNRYAYVNNDPLNFVDRNGLNMAVAECHFGVIGTKEHIEGGLDFRFGWICTIKVIDTGRRGGPDSDPGPGTEVDPQNTGELRVLEEAQRRVSANYDRCRSRVFGNSQTFADRNIIGGEEAVLALFAGRLSTDITAMVAAIWAHESNYEQRPDGDAGPAQLTSWWRNNHPELIVGNAYGSWHGRTNGVPFDGNVRDNLATLGNIVRFSRDRYGDDRSIAYWYGPGDPNNAANAVRNRNEYANHVMQLYQANQRFFDCLAQP